MASKKSSIEGCVAHVYDTRDNLLATTKITGYDPKWAEIEIEECPNVRKGDACRILILSFPSPCEYMGIVRRQVKLSAVIAVYRGHEKENRKNTRYNVNASAVVKKIVRHSGETPIVLVVNMLNISRGGARISAPADALAVGDIFEMSLRAGEGEERLFAAVVNVSRSESADVTYGCRFIKKGRPSGH